MVPPNLPGLPDEALTLLDAPHRRSIVFYFIDSTADDAALTDLAEFVSDRSGDPADRVATKLHHADLPRLAEAGILEYDARSRTIRYRGSEELETIADSLGVP